MEILTQLERSVPGSQASMWTETRNEDCGQVQSVGISPDARFFNAGGSAELPAGAPITRLGPGCTVRRIARPAQTQSVGTRISN
jgi:hypothetical protein